MSVPEGLEKLVGKWRGINRLHAPWMKENPIQESDSNALVEFTANGTFLKIEYDWAFEGATQEGLMLIGNEKDSNLVKVFWIDSWHLSNTYMVSEGQRDESGAISVKGFYTVPDHPDWGWRTVFESETDDFFKITMYNVSPEGEETLAVEAELKRQ